MAGDGRFVVQDLSPSAPPYWTPSEEQQLVTCVVGHQPIGSTTSSSSSFVDDESTSYEDIKYTGYGPQSTAVGLLAAANCDYDGSLYHHHLQQPQHQQQHQQPPPPPHHQQFGNGGYYDGGGSYHHLGYDDKPPPYDNNNAADACDMNSAAASAAVVYEDPYVASRVERQPPAQQVRGPRDPILGWGAIDCAALFCRVRVFTAPSAATGIMNVSSSHAIPAAFF